MYAKQKPLHTQHPTKYTLSVKMYQPESFIDAEVRGILCFFVLGIISYFSLFVKRFLNIFQKNAGKLFQRFKASPENTISVIISSYVKPLF